MVIVSGRIFVRSDKRQEFLSLSSDAIVKARQTPGCLDFVVAADPVEPDRVNVYEAWETEEALLRFRGQGPANEITALITGAEVARHMVASTGPA